MEQHLLAFLKSDLDLVWWDRALDCAEPKLGMVDDIARRKNVIHVVRLYRPFWVDAKRVCILGASGAGFSFCGRGARASCSIRNGSRLHLVIVRAAAHRAGDPADYFAIHRVDDVGSLVFAFAAIRT